MRSRGRRAWAGGLVAAGLAVALADGPGSPGPRTNDLPDRLTDREFWDLSIRLSEQGGTFESENFVSNEGGFQRVIPDLVARVRPGGVYVGVGPEQNFTYIAAVRPRLAFIVDIRRGNLHLHLLYKALFELSADRAEFVSRLFSRARPSVVSAQTGPAVLLAAFDRMPASEARFEANLREVIGLLTDVHDLPLSAGDRAGIAHVYRNGFFAGGPGLHYRLSGTSRRTEVSTLPSYATLMAADDGAGVARSYLASEELFAVVKDLQWRTLVVPVVGDFGGPKSLPAIGAYAAARDAVVSAFYVSNVERYLRRDGTWGAFCASVASMPLDPTSTFIRADRSGGDHRPGPAGDALLAFTTSLAPMRAEIASCGAP